MLQPGTWMVKVVRCGFIGEDADGRAQLSIYFEDETGDGITWYSALGTLKDGGFSEKSFKFGCDQLKALGWDAEKEKWAFEALGTDDSPLLGREAEIVVVAETYDGKERIKVKYVNDPNRPKMGQERMAPDQAKRFADRLRSHLGVKAPPARPAAPKKPEPTGMVDEEGAPW